MMRHRLTRQESALLRPPIQTGQHLLSLVLSRFSACDLKRHRRGCPCAWHSCEKSRFDSYDASPLAEIVNRPPELP